MSFKAGDIVRDKKTDRTFELEDVNPNPNYEADYEEYASGRSDYGTESVLSPDDIELVMSAADAAKRKTPTPDDIVKGLDLMRGWQAAVDVDETDFEGDGTVSCYGTTPDGLRVSFQVTVSNVYRD